MAGNPTISERATATASMTDGLRSTPKSSASDRLSKGREAAEKILRRYPDYEKSPAAYKAALVEAIAGCADPVIAAMLDLRTGLSAKCRYLPTVADVMDFVGDYEKRHTFIAPRPAWMERKPEGPAQIGFQIDYDARRLQVQRAKAAMAEWKPEPPRGVPDPRNGPDAPWRKEGPPSDALLAAMGLPKKEDAA